MEAGEFEHGRLLSLSLASVISLRSSHVLPRLLRFACYLKRSSPPSSPVFLFTKKAVDLIPTSDRLSRFVFTRRISRICRADKCSTLFPTLIQFASSIRRLTRELFRDSSTGMTTVKLEEVVCHEPDESELNLFSDNGSENVVYQLLDQKSSERRWLSERFLRWRRRYLPVDGDNRRDHGSVKQSGPFVSGAAYCISSCSMIILNKIVLSSYNFNAGISLMLYQNLISCLVVAVLDICGVVSVEKFNWKLIRVWMPVNVIFVGMLVSGMYSLKYINVAMVTILKNATNIITAIGEVYIFRKRQNNKVWAAMFMMIISAISGGITDLTYDAVGYTWQLANCVLTASYSLTLRRVMDKAKQSTKSGSLNEVSMVLLNNLLSLPFGIILVILLGEWRYVISTDVTKDAMFWVVATASGFLGLAISFTSMWFLHQTGPTTYSLVGSLNKVPISLAGLVLFKVPLSLPNLFSILFGLFAGVVFARAKMS